MKIKKLSWKYARERKIVCIVDKLSEVIDYINQKGKVMCEEETEYITMIDYAVALAVREIVAKIVSDKVGIDVMEGRQILIDLLKDEKDVPENIRFWFERNIN